MRTVDLSGIWECSVPGQTGSVRLPGTLDEAGIGSPDDPLKQYRAYGINCVRFHSHCPPEAAFTTADQLGMLMQPSLGQEGPCASPGHRQVHNGNAGQEISQQLASADHPGLRGVIGSGSGISADKDFHKLASPVTVSRRSSPGAAALPPRSPAPYFPASWAGPSPLRRTSAVHSACHPARRRRRSFSRPV